MSASTFRQHVRALTGVSPLQDQKQLRLQEARQLMRNENSTQGGAPVRVGYESASQLSREYSRLFGAPRSAILRVCGSLPGRLARRAPSSREVHRWQSWLRHRSTRPALGPR